MKRFTVAALVWLIAFPALGQSLAEVAKREKDRRKKNRDSGVQVRSLSGSDLPKPAPVAPPQEPTSEASSMAETSSGEEPGPAVSPTAGVAVPPPPPAPPTSPLRPVLNPAPSFSLEDRSGRRVALSDFQGQAVLLDFWATWCSPCRATMPEVDSLDRRYRGRGLQVVGINIEGRSKEVLDYLDETGFGFLMLFDQGNWNSPVARQYGVSSIPRTILIDRRRNIVFSGHPEELSESLIEAALQ